MAMIRSSVQAFILFLFLTILLSLNSCRDTPEEANHRTTEAVLETKLTDLPTHDLLNSVLVTPETNQSLQGRTDLDNASNRILTEESDAKNKSTEEQWPELLLLKLAEEFDGQYFCKQGSDYFGEIGLYDLETDSFHSLIQNDKGIYYEGTSLNRGSTKFAFIKIDESSGFKQSFTSEAFLHTYESSDQIISYDLEQNQQYRINSSFSRIEAVFPDGPCSVASGVVDLLGWSPSSSWIAYSRKTLEGRVIGFLNLTTLKPPIEIIGLIKGGWSEFGDEYIAYDNSNKSRELLYINLNEDLLSQRYPIPLDIPEDSSLRSVAWEKSNKIYILFDIANRLMPYKTTLWTFNLDDVIWENLGSIEMDPAPLTILVGNYLVSCTIGDSIGTIHIRSLPNFDVIYEQKTNVTYKCDGIAAKKNPDTGEAIVTFLVQHDKLIIIHTNQQNVQVREVQINLPERLKDKYITDIEIVR